MHKVRGARKTRHNQGEKEHAGEPAPKKKVKLRDQVGSILRQYRKQSASSTRAEPMQRPWQLQTAKARFSEVFRLARTVGPQLITRQGKEAVVVISVEQFEQFAARTREPVSLVQFFADSPLAGLELNFDRSKD